MDAEYNSAVAQTKSKLVAVSEANASKGADVIKRLRFSRGFTTKASVVVDCGKPHVSRPYARRTRQVW